MKTNMGLMDRAVRLVIAIVLVYLAYVLTISSAWSTVLLVIAGILLITGTIGVCPLYRGLGISSHHKKHKTS